MLLNSSLQSFESALGTTFDLFSRENVSEAASLTDSLMKDGVMTTVVGSAARTLKKGDKVRVYRNLNKPEFFSIMACSGEHKGLVCGYARAVSLTNGRFVVSEKSRQRVLLEKRRNVHAFVEGELDDAAGTIQSTVDSLQEISYNPYKMGSFFVVSTGQAIETATFEYVVTQGSHVYKR
jgi:hypothetical protein